MDLKDLEKAVSKLVFDLKPISEIPTDTVPYELIAFDYSEKDNSK